jgi:aminoglycoside phosphotransferase (APT) family kinase protein
MWKLAARDPDGFTAARPLGWSPALNAAWQEALPGLPLMDVIMGGGDLPALMVGAGRGLARLHAAAPPAGVRSTTLADRLRFAHGGPRELADAYPHLTARLARITDPLEREASRLGDAEPRLVHGDFLLKQLVVGDDGRFGLFDFDDFMIGDCLEDVANCMVDMHYWDLPPEVVAGMAGDFLAAYREHADWPVPEERLRWHRSVQLLRDAWYWYKRRHLEPTFRFELEAMLLRAEDPPDY